MELEWTWLLLALPVAFALGWLASRLDLRQWRREQRDAPRAYFKGLNLLLNEQQDKAIDAFIDAVRADPDTTELHFALGNLFRRRGEFERAVRVHQHLLGRADLGRADRDRAQEALAQDYLKAGLLDRAEAAFEALLGTAFDTDARLALLALHERSRDWAAAIEGARALEAAGAGSFAARIAHYLCEQAVEAADAGRRGESWELLAQARAAAPDAARPLVELALRRAAAGDAAAMLEAWGELRRRHAGAFALVAVELARRAVELGQRDAALALAREQAAREPGLELLQALALLDDDAARHAQRLQRHLAEHPSLGAAAAALETAAPLEPLRAALRAAVVQAARPLQRYRCAACGFVAQQPYWQCPGCLSWDSYPPRRLEEQ